MQAQSLQGFVYDSATHKLLYPVTVVNVSTQQTVYTDEKGVYSIPAKTGDLVAFTYVGYKSVEKRKPAAILVATLNIAMPATEYQLKEVQIRPGHLSKYQVDSLERRQIYRTDLQRTHPSPVMSPASAIAEKFSKRAKRVYRFQKVFQTEEQNLFINTRYNADVVAGLTHLNEDSVGYFMNAYPIAYDFARAASDLELQMWVRSNFREWIAKGKDTTTASKH